MSCLVIYYVNLQMRVSLKLFLSTVAFTKEFLLDMKILTLVGCLPYLC